MRPLLRIFAAAFFFAGIAQARIGDTEEQIRTRYGEPLTVLSSRPADVGLTKCYLSHGFLIAVTYLNAHSARETVTKADNSKITETEIHNLLDAHGSGSRWNAQQLAGPKSLTAGVQKWRSADERSRVAIYDSQTRALFITTQQFIDLTNAKRQQTASRGNAGMPVTTTRGNAGALGTIGRLQRSGLLFDKSTLRNGQPQPSASPAK